VEPEGAGENGGGVVRGGADDFDTAFEGLVVGLRSHESGEKRVVDVDDVLRESGDEVIAEDLHVASHDDGFNVVLTEEGDFFFFLFRFSFLGDGEDVIGDVEAVGDVLEVGVITDDEGDFDVGEVSSFVTGEDVVEAVRVF